MGRKRLAARFGIALLFVSGTLFRLIGLDSDNLWVDEAITWWWLSMDWRGLVNILFQNVGNLPAFYFTAKPITALFGSSELSLRALSALTGVISIAVAYKIGERAGGKPAAMAGLWLWVFHPMAIWYSRDAKEYAFTLLLSAGTFLFFLKARQNRNAANLFMSLFLMSVGLLSHFFFFVFSTGLILYLIFDLRRRPRFFRTWTLLFLTALIPLGFWLGSIFSKPDPSLGSGWISPVAPEDTILTVWNLSSGYAGAFSISSTVFGMIVVGVIGLSFVNSKNRISNGRLFISCLAAPIAGVFIVSLKRPIYVDRYFIVLLPIVTYLFSHGASIIWKATETRHFRWVTYTLILGGLYLVGFFSGLNTLLDPTYARESWATLASDLSKNAETTPVIWFSDQASLIAFEYYFEGSFDLVWTETPPVCEEGCWWVLRQPFTSTHAFTQAINPKQRNWLPEIPDQCFIARSIDYQTGILLWNVNCERKNNAG